ncbi:hypothetical protein [Stenotrophomonas sp. NRRL B-14846]|uniref:hypothetical protein n=1 Tax=Stenotrophomonas sp. NRRL B-14846 TaxID=3162882 RepID=UPI003D2A0860
MKALADAIDHLVDAGGVYVREVADSAMVSGLGERDTDALRALCRELKWEYVVLDAAGEQVDGVQPTPEGLGPYRLQVKKPEAEGGVLRLLTLSGFRNALRDEAQAPIWAIAGFTGRIVTGLRALQGWDDATPPKEEPPTKSPRRLVREYTQARKVPIDLRLWLPTELDEATFNQPVAQIWVQSAMAALTACIPNEIDPDEGTLKFRGPPRLELSRFRPAEVAVERALFNSLVKALRWTFENEREAELKHTLLAGELARSGPSSEDVVVFLRTHLEHSLESAEIAYQMTLSETGRDTMKILGELRRTVSDETAKIADMSRQLTGAVSAAVATGIGLIAARVAANAPTLLIMAVIGVVLVYIAMIIFSGLRYMRLQSSLRGEWQHRLYRFLPASEYTTLVTAPTKQAESSFRMTAYLGGAAVMILSLACAWFALSPQNDVVTKPKQEVSSTSSNEPDRRLPRDINHECGINEPCKLTGLGQEKSETIKVESDARSLKQ